MAASELKPMLYAASVAPLAEDALYAAAYAAVSPERQQRTDRFRFPRDRRLSLGAELLLRYALHQAGENIHPEFTCNANGKPYLKNSPLFFSLSHSGDYVLCALASCEVGCDIQEMHPMDLRIAKRFFAPEEYADIAAQPTETAQTALFYRYWTLKESFMKVTGLGMQLPFSAFRILRGEELSVLQSVDARSYSFREFSDIPGYCCALAAAGNSRGTVLQQADLREILVSPEMCPQYLDSLWNSFI